MSSEAGGRSAPVLLGFLHGFSVFLIQGGCRHIPAGDHKIFIVLGHCRLSLHPQLYLGTKEEWEAAFLSDVDNLFLFGMKTQQGRVLKQLCPF